MNSTCWPVRRTFMMTSGWCCCCADIRNIRPAASTVQPLWIEKAPDQRYNRRSGARKISQETGLAGAGEGFGATFAAALAALVEAGLCRGRFLQGHNGCLLTVLYVGNNLRREGR